MHAVRGPVDLDADELLALAVVHDDVAAKVAGTVAAHEPLELPPPGTPAEAAGDEDGLPVAGDSCRGERLEHRGQRVASRIVRGGGDGECGRLHHDRDAAAPRRCGPERRPRERVAERLGDRGADVGDRIDGGRRREQDRVVGEGDEG